MKITKLGALITRTLSNFHGEYPGISIELLNLEL